MAFLNGMMQMPQQVPASWQSRLGGLLSGEDALFNMGIGILANNNDGTFGGAVGRGMAQGMQQTRQAQQYKLQQKTQENQNKRQEREDKAAQMQEQAHLDFDLQHPQYKGLSRLSPAAAMKIAYPSASANSADPYTSMQYDGKGNAYLFNHRETDPAKALQPINVGGANFTGAKYSSPLIEDNERAKSKGDAAYKITTDEPGLAQTVEQLAEKSNPSLRNPPPFQMQPELIRPPVRAPQAQTNSSMQIAPQVQAQRDDKRMQILLAEQQSQGGAGVDKYLDAEIANMQPRGGGIRVPTRAQQAGDEAQAKANVELTMKPQIEAATTTSVAKTKSLQSAEKGTVTLNSMMRYLYKDGVPVRDGANRLIPPKEPMILGNSITDRASMTGHEYGLTNNKASNVIGVRRLINSLVLDANNGSLGAGVSNADVEFLQKIQGVINSAQAPEDIYNAIADNEDRFNRILNAKKAGNGATDATNAPTPAPAKTFNALPKTAPKGQILRNPTTGARKQFNGLTWVDIK